MELFPEREWFKGREEQVWGQNLPLQYVLGRVHRIPLMKALTAETQGLKMTRTFLIA